MKKPILLLMTVGAVLGGGGAALRAWSTPSHAEEEADLSVPAALSAPKAAQPSQERAAEGHAAAPSAAQGSLPGASPSTLDTALSEDEEAVLGMYDEMGLAFERHASDCSGAARAIGEIIDAHEEALQRLVAGARKRGAQEAREADDRLEATAGNQMRASRALISKALSTCPNELMPELKRLGAIEGDTP